ncbi:MAG: hypothetical protein HYZ00_14780, partial [Candidatus Hydrogenedentes bacterium]|nr:hypothetical protein [Candidatus Hydrogenedentota bacterium]
MNAVKLAIWIPAFAGMTRWGAESLLPVISAKAGIQKSFLACLFTLACLTGVAEGPVALDVEHAREFETVQAQISGFRADVSAQSRLRREALDEAALIAETDRDPVDVVLRRTQALLDDVRQIDNAPVLQAEGEELVRLREKGLRIPVGDPARQALYSDVCALRRRIAFANPLLDFSDILFLEHDRARYEHMVDQYFGFHAVPGGGVFALRDAFGPSAHVEELLAGSKVERGRLQGKTLANGSFVSLDLSYDARSILFAWTEAEVPAEPTDRTPMEQLWKLESTYHIFRANVDGTGLVQLTDGAYNDFDPCWLPNGRICFVSERRGGFLRCGIRPDPTYTLHSMRDDGSDIIALSFHETHEWHPSVDNNGMIVYSRWDYVDRDSDIAHHLWLTYPDGRDPRSYHGNYPSERESRPWMELSIRAVPDSPKYVAVAAPHHGQNYGSLVLIDLQQPDDRAMAQLKRITPDVALPEAETAPGVSCAAHGGRNNRRSEVYGTPWPLSEKYYLCVYDPGQKNYGLYLIDAFGNRELLYRDPNIACLDPMPLRSRTLPPVIPPRTRQAMEDKVAGATEDGRLAIMNIYASELPWPKDTRITALRVIQLFPKTTPVQDEPNIGTGLESLARGVLGTAPVEEDGSVYCRVPVGVPLYFQALDAQGRAVQTMLSDTYVHPGETLSCMGCHEAKRDATPAALAQLPAAMRRSPSELKPEADGAYPLLFPRLVQPVLDKHCVRCHGDGGDAPNLEGTTFAEWGWSQSYHALAPYAWAKHGGNGAIEKNRGSFSAPG